MEKEKRDPNPEASKTIDAIISGYYPAEFKADFSLLTPYQKISLFIRLLGMRVPKFKAVDLHAETDITPEELERCIGRLLRLPGHNDD